MGGRGTWPGKVRKEWGMRSKVAGKDRVDLGGWNLSDLNFQLTVGICNGKASLPRV